MSKSVRDPLTPDDLFSDMKGVDDPYFGGATAKETGGSVAFDPNANEYVHGTTAFDDPEAAQRVNADSQPLGDLVGRSAIQFGANVLSSIGQGLANTFDVVSNLKTAKGLITGSNDDFNSSLFGLSSRDMQAWANGVAQRNQIYEKDPGSFNLSDPAWWGQQLASAGTGVGMGLEALGETAAIEFATGGLGTAAAIGKLGELIKNIGKGVKGAETLNEAFNAAKGLKSAATIFGVMSRLNESRMEANNTHDDIVQSLSQEKDDKGARKYNDDEVEQLASAGARRDYAWNLALLPLDILSYRTMVFNPISGTGEGLVEKGLEKIAGVFGKSTLGKAAGWTTDKLIGSQFEGMEEGFQQVGQDEGRHYARVLGGMDDGSSFAQRFGQDIQTDEFWNNYAGGVLGSPIIAGAMGLVNRVTHGNQSAKIDAAHKYYVQEVGKMDNAIATKIKDYEDNGQDKEASILRRQFGAMKALSGLRLDATTDKDTAFDSRMNFLNTTLGELNEGKTDSLGDLGFFNVNPKNLDKIKDEFKSYVDDAESMKEIYDNVKNKYNKNFVPAIANDHFQLNRLLSEEATVNTTINTERAKLSQYNLLSTQGKEVHDSEYQIRALNTERGRLANQLQTTEDTHEKDNINKLLSQNESRLAEVKDRLDEVNKDETYTTNLKDSDADIINSSLRGKEYQQAIYDKVHLDNAIALQRKNIALWNNSEYINNQVKKSVNNAKTKEQISNNIAPQAKVTPEVAEVVKNKEDEIEATDAAADVVEPGYGNSNLFDDDNQFINNISNAVTPSLVVNQSGGLEETNLSNTEGDSFEPTVFDFNKSSDEAKNNVKNGVDGLLNKLGDNASFEDLVRHVVNVQGKETADKIFNALKWGWEANGKPVVDYDAVYKNVFGNPMDMLIAGASQLIASTPDQVKQITDDTTNKVIAQQNKPEGFDDNGQPVYIYEDKEGNKTYVTNESSPKAAFSTFGYTTITEVGEGNTVNVSYDSDKILTDKNNKWVDSKINLDPDKLNEGTKTTIKIPTDFNDIVIGVFDGDGKYNKFIPFGQWVAENNISPDSQEYKDKIPMIHYLNDNSNRGKGVFFVHDIQWYHPLRFNQDHPDDMAKAIASTRAIRQEVLDSKNNSIGATITGKRQTTFNGLKVDTPITLREANPQTKITVVAGDVTSLLDSNSKKPEDIAFPNNNKLLVNTDPFLFNGQVIDVRRFGKKDGVDTYIGLPVVRKKIDEVTQNSIVQAITIYASRNFLTPQQKATVEHIKSTMGTDMDITASPSGAVASGIKGYLSHFIRIYDPNKSSTNAEIEAQAKQDLAFGTPYISFISGGNIVFGQAGKAIYINTNKKDTLMKGGMSEGDATEQAKVYSLFINPSMSKLAPSLSRLNEKITTTNSKGENETSTRLGWYEQSVNLDALAANKKIVTIDSNGTSKVASNSYHDYLLDNLTSNIKSINIGTEQNPNYVTNIQPIITYDSDTRLASERTIPTNQQIKEEIIPKETEKDDVQPMAKSASDILKEELDRAQKNLGNDLGIASREDMDSFEPEVLSMEKREEIGQSIDRIAGLHPHQQTTITNFIFNQIAGLVNLENPLVEKADVDKQVEKTFNEVIQPIRDRNSAEITRLEGLLQTYPEFNDSRMPQDIKDYKYTVSQIDNIRDSFDTLKDIAYEKVKKNTGILQNKQILEREEGETEYADEDTTRATDFWTDVLTESPENKLSYAMRRFFGQTRMLDKEGKPMSGFLNIPLYEDASAITRDLMTTLVDVPANFKDMMARLEEKKDGKPWMQDIINKLNGASQQRKNQFVTVMHNTSLRMKFSMIGYDRKGKSWNIKLMDSTLNGVSATLKDIWDNNLFGDSDFNLVLGDEEGNQILNKKKAESLLHRFENWTGEGAKSIISSVDTLKNAANQVGDNKPITVEVTPSPLLNELKSNIVKGGDRMKFSISGRTFQIIGLGNNKYQLSFMGNSATNAEVTSWLREFGITVNPNTIKEMRTRGLLHNYKIRKWGELFQTGKSNGLFGILYDHLKDLVNREGVFDFTDFGNSPLDNSVISSLANEDAKHTDIQAIFGFRVMGKSYFALTAPSFISDRARDLKSQDSTLRDQLKQTSFSSTSLWLNLLGDQDFKGRFQIVDDSAESLKQTGKKSYRDASIASLSDADHDLTKISKFQVMTQGEVRYGKDGLNKYPDTGISLRMATMFGLTMADKDRMKLIITAVLNLGNTHLKDGVHDEVLKVLYDQAVKPELLRMTQHANNKGVTDIVGYDKGASIFLMFPELNNIMVNPSLKLVDAIKHQPTKFNTSYVENNPEMMKNIKDIIKSYIDQLVQEKLEVWEKNGYVARDKDGNIDEIKFFDKKYMAKFSGTKEEQLRMAAMDYEINSIVSNANQFMLLAGDPAMYFKSKSTDYVQQAKDTFVNVNKRLANQVAPGTTIPNSEGEKYLQVFMNDRVGVANNIDYLERILGKEGAAGYRDIKVSDAQEYTTWKEHLDILNRLGKSADYMFDITPEEIVATRALISSGLSKSELSAKQLDMILKVMQPIKPVYTGQIYDKDQDAMRTVYIKSSSFPLIPQLTVGLELDKLRIRMEQIQDRTKMNIRASYQSANKVGALNLSSDIRMWNDDGTVNDDTLKNLSKYTLPLERKNFRIQQEVPFKSDKTKEDTITLGTQLMKLLFGDDMMNQKGFILNGKEYTGKDLHQQYTDNFIKLIKEKQNQLYNELGLNEKGEPIDTVASMKKLQNLLESEAKKRGYPLQDIKGLQIDPITGNFSMPLWASANSNRYESMLNAIVSKRMVAMKLPGTSAITGSEEGFRVKKESDLSKQDKSGIVYTSHWDGKELQPNQVFMPSKFRGHDGNLLDLLTKEDGKYKYVTENETGFKLKENMFDKELLQNLTFRIPTSGHQSGSLVNIAGFLPHTTGDLVIVSKNAVIQKGLDFDVDKENAYQLWTHLTKEGKFEILNEDHRKEILLQAEQLKNNKKIAELQQQYKEAGPLGKKKIVEEIHKEIAAQKLFDTIGGEYTDEDIADLGLSKTSSKVTEKLLQNEIIKINHSVYANPSDEVQSKVSRTLSTKYAEDQANMIDGLINQSKATKLWTPLGSEHQKQTLMSGVGGKIGTGAYSLDVTFHSLVQQANQSGKPVELFSRTDGEDGLMKIDNRKWKFGNIESDGILGNSKTLDGGRTISEVMSERQNIAVDNATLQVMGKVNLNGITLDVDKVFNMLGIDKGSDGNSIPFLFLSQPIIREYVDQMKNAGSIMADYEEAKEDKIVNALLAKYNEETKEEDINDTYWDTMSSEMNNPNLINALSSQTPDGKLQGAVLRRFMEMKQYGTALRGIQTSINFSNNGFGKSFFDVIEKKNQLNRLGNDSIIKNNGVEVGYISGQDELVGDYYDKEIFNEAPEGSIDIGNFFVRPTTVMGGFNVHATMTAYNLWNKYFPYDTAASQAIFDEILPIIGNIDSMSKSRTVDNKQDIFRDIKRYLAASQMNGIINNTDNVNAERSRLYIDSEKNTSLAKYVKTLMQTNDNPAINTFIKTNKLFNRFEFDLKKDGTPSLIKYNNAAGEEFDEQYLYESLSSLLQPNGKTGTVQLPTIGNKSYTLDSLAQDLIAYSFLGNAVQEAIQFTKYVPVAYLNTVGYSNWLTNNTDTLGIKPTTGTKGSEHLVSEFAMQYIQHNPGAIKYRLDANIAGVGKEGGWGSVLNNKLIEYNIGAINSLSELETFKLKNEDRPIFVSIYNPALPKGGNKYQLYWFDGAKYTRIPVLGMFGMDEYQQGLGIGQSIVNGKVKITATPQQTIEHDQEYPEDVYDVNSGNLKNILGKIEEANIDGFSQLANAIAPYIGNTKIRYATHEEVEGMRAAFEHNGNEIYINTNWFKEASGWQMARTILHETIHSLTVNQIKPYINQDRNGNVDVNNNAPSYVTDLVRLYNDVRSKNDTKELQAVMNKVQSGQKLTQGEYDTKYGLYNIYEFMAMATTHPEFQKYLASSQFKQSGQTLLDRFKDIIKQVLTKLGVKFESDTATAHALNSIFNLIEETSKNNISDVYKKMADDAMSENFDEENTTPPDDSFESIIKDANEMYSAIKVSTLPVTDREKKLRVLKNILFDTRNNSYTGYKQITKDTLKYFDNPVAREIYQQALYNIENGTKLIKDRFGSSSELQDKIPLGTPFNGVDNIDRGLLSITGSKLSKEYPEYIKSISTDLINKAIYIELTNNRDSFEAFPKKDLDIKEEKCI